MAGMWCLGVVMLVMATIIPEPAFSNPQINRLGKPGCSQYNYSDVLNYMSVLNASFADLRNQLSTKNLTFATVQSPPVFALTQCRDYLSVADCVACFDAAVLETRNCSTATGARVMFDGCFLRYEDGDSFFTEITDAGTSPVCGKRTAPNQDVFNTTAQQLLSDLIVATPKTKSLFAAAKKVSTGGNATAFAVAQCLGTINQVSCQQCLTITYTNIKACLPKSAAARGISAGCFLRYSNKRFFSNDQTTDLAPFLKVGRSAKKKAIIGGVVGGTMGIILVLAAIFLFYRQSQNLKAARRGDILETKKLRGPENYRYKDLTAATKYFSEENKLGEGGFGEVYKGTLKNGDVIAVKKLAMASCRAKTDLDTEVRLVTNVHHRNLVRLIGCSANGEELLLVYEYMANSSLDRYIFGHKGGILNWKQRVNIIFGTARGLEYLHELFHVCIIHRDIKSSNILLDDEFQPKISDFGLARLLPEDKSHVSTEYAGTMGYTAPEYAIHGHLSEKVDTYSFGIVVLEIISGGRVETVTEFLLEHAWKLYEERDYLGLLDETIDPKECKEEEVKRMLEIALVCTQSTPHLRPSMSEVVVMFSSDLPIFQHPPERPSILETNVFTDTSRTTASSTSVTSG